MKGEFIDSSGTRGRPRFENRTLNRTIQGKTIVFEPLSATHIQLRIQTPKWLYGTGSTAIFPDRTIRVTKKDAIKLAHWLLDTCSTP